MPEAQPLRPDDPSRLGAYVLDGRLGEGGQGTVFLGTSPAGEQVAVKLLHAVDDPMARSRFVRELAVAKRVATFCTAQVLDADVAGDRPYIVSEFVAGPTLQESVTREGPRGKGALERLAIGTATALTAIHRAGVVHRDFKPANVLLGSDGPRVIDFGIARALDVTAPVSQLIGTPSYMAPEQLTDQAVGSAADVFAWGSTMVFAATGRLPRAPEVRRSASRAPAGWSVARPRARPSDAAHRWPRRTGRAARRRDPPRHRARDAGKPLGDSGSSETPKQSKRS
jgi:serine/threonine protein kinase